MPTPPKSKYDVSHIKVRSISKKKFDKMTPAQQRVAIAKDVILRLSAGKITQKRGQFLTFKNEKLNKSYITSLCVEGLTSQLCQADARKYLQENQCQVCAKGALVYSMVANFNERKLHEVYDKSWTKGLDDIFPHDMREAMEAVFEGYGFRPMMSLRRIMENIIKNKGSFVTDNRTYPMPSPSLF